MKKTLFSGGDESAGVVILNGVFPVHLIEKKIEAADALGVF